MRKLCDCSLRGLQRHFEQCHCKPPRAWLMEVKLWDAARLLEEGLDVKEISLNCGFKDVSHFYHRFKMYHGCTPIQFFEIHQQRESVRRESLRNAFLNEESDAAERLQQPKYARALEILNRSPMFLKSPVSLAWFRDQQSLESRVEGKRNGHLAATSSGRNHLAPEVRSQFET
ncbi:MAG: helix-turn-helix domain-containing protein [Verrucomicrobia bacterium]|nr:helix-turn-helix domain-containing protein [Verrucomicrobiota bacterium]